MPTARLLVFVIAAALLAGCQISAPAAAKAPPPSPQSIAYRAGQVPPPPGGWTTPAVPETGIPETGIPETGIPETGGRSEPGRRLETSNTVRIFGIPISVPQSVIVQAESSRDRRVGDAVERRTRVGNLRGGPSEWIATWQSTYQWGTALDGGIGDAPDLFTNRFRLSHEVSLPLFGRLGLFGDYVNRRYSFSGSNDFIAGTDDPWGTVHRLAVGANMFQPVSESWAIFLASDVRWHAEDGANLSDGFSWTVTAGVGYRASDVLDLGLGFIVSDTFGNEIFFLGGPQFDWRPNERWRVVLQGTELEIQHNIGRSWQIAGAGGFLGHRFRLNDDGPLANGIAAETRFPIWLQVRYRGLANMDLTLRAGVDLSRQFRIEDSHGNTLRTFTTDPSPFLSFRGIWRL